MCRRFRTSSITTCPTSATIMSTASEGLVGWADRGSPFRSWARTKGTCSRRSSNGSTECSRRILCPRSSASVVLAQRPAMGPFPRFQNRRGRLGRGCLDLGLGIQPKANLSLRFKPICLLEQLLRAGRLGGPRAAAACEDGKRKEAGEEMNARAQGRKDAREEINARAQGRKDAREEMNARAQGRKDAREEMNARAQGRKDAREEMNARTQGKTTAEI